MTFGTYYVNHPFKICTENNQILQPDCSVSNNTLGNVRYIYRGGI